jgi:uncharacterized LabA/DUF88 family protein
MMLRLMIFIDGSNLYHESDRFSKGLRIDFEKFRTELTGDFDLIRTFYYASVPANPTADQTGFFKKLGYLGYKTKIKPLRETSFNGRRETREKGVDVALATDLVSYGMRKAFDWAIIVSGDQDFCDAIEHVQSQGLRVEVVFYRHAMAEELKLRADRYRFIDDFADRITIGGAPLSEPRSDYHGRERPARSDDN